ncbi:MAG: twin-arginine translocase TatA/TatE family subunit [Gluconobacter potus]|uniref:Sec-independent protein translocase subunit TatA/TatB n=1 Tax=Gluconobacter potus TaxID=2724927 RepID=UPI0039E8D503
MFGFTWSEIAVVVISGVILLKPKDLPEIIQALKKTRRKMADLQHDMVKRITALSHEIESGSIPEELQSLTKDISAISDTYTESETRAFEPSICDIKNGLPRTLSEIKDLPQTRFAIAPRGQNDTSDDVGQAKT